MLSWIDELEAIDALVAMLGDRALPGVLGPKAASARFAAAWSNASGQPARLETRGGSFASSG